MRPLVPLLLTALLASACRNDDEDTAVTALPTTGPTTTTLTGPECTPVAPETWDTRFLQYPGEEFAFDDQGRLFTVVDWASAVWATDRAFDWTYIGPFQTEEAAGVDFMLGGDLVVCDEANGAVQRVTPTGSTTTLSGAVPSPNSIAVRDTGFVYVTAFDRILRLHPETGAATEIAAFPGQDLDGLVFTPDFSRLWFNIDEDGSIWSIALGPDGEPGELVLEAEIKADNDAQLDGMAMDRCGNLYVSRTDGRISLVPAEGEVIGRWVKVSDDAYTSALHFGSGIGGWERDHLYVMDRTGSLHDLYVGIEGAPEPHL